MEIKNNDHDYSLAPIPDHEKRGFMPMLVVMLGYAFFSASMIAGGNLGRHLRMGDFIEVVFLGNFFLCIYIGLLSYIASDTGLSTHLLARYSFGEKGSYIVSFLVGATQIGWFAVGIALFAMPTSNLLGVDLNIVVLVSGILMTLTAFFGIKSLTILSMIAVPFIVILGMTSIGIAISDIGGFQKLLSIESQDIMSMNTALSIVIGTFIGGGTMTPDVIRFAKSKKVAISSTIIAFLIGNSLMLIIGAIGAKVTGLADVSGVMYAQGLVIPAIIILGLNIWTTNDNALYGSALGFSNITKKSKKKIVLINGIIGTLLSITIYRNFTTWLTIIVSFIPATGAILIADYFVINKRKYKDLKEIKFKNININAITAWISGVIGGAIVPGISPMNSVLISMVTYILLTKYIAKNEIKSAIMDNEMVA